jgi:membrane-associated protease RseP (regulator of RpoE activity)
LPAGFMVNVMPAGKMDQNMMMFNGSMPPTSAADGTFTVPNAPAGRVQIMVFPTDMRGSLYAFARKVATVEGGRTNDVGEIKVQKMRARPDEKAGDFGFQLKQPGQDADLDKLRLEVAVVRPDGPAAKAGMKVGDVIVSVDGQDVRQDATQYWILAHVPPGTAVTFGLERGASLKLTAGPPRE